MKGTAILGARATIVSALMAFACAALLALSISAGASEAYAATQSSSAEAANASADSQMAAAKQSVWVLDEAIMTYSGENEMLTTKYAYTEKGLLNKIANVNYKESRKYVYDSKDRFKFMDFSGLKTKFVCDKQGRVTSTTDEEPATYAYDENGYLEKYTSTGQTNAYTYNKKGQLVKVVSQGPATQDGKDIYKYTYDSLGQLRSVSGSQKATIRNVYRNGRLVSQKITQAALPDIVLSYSYKKAFVPKDLVAQVKAQQKSLLINQVFYGVPLEAAYK